MPTHEMNKAIIRRFYEHLWNEWSFDTIPELISPDCRFRGSLGVTVRGRLGFRRYMERVRRAMPDFHNRVEELVAERDRVAARLTYTGTHRGNLLGVAPTGRRVRYAGMARFVLRRGRIVDGWVLGDLHGLLKRLGGS